jgi:predicted transcriptional regulator
MQKNSRGFSSLTTEQLELIKHFQAAYNAIDRKLRSLLNLGEEVSFAQVLRTYSSNHPTWRDRCDILRELGDLRNTLVHNETRPDRYLAVPLPDIVMRIEQIRDDLIHPLLVIPKFQRQVDIVVSHAFLATALRTMHDGNYSQLPVYDDDIFQGVITENGIARWLARYVSNKDEIVDLSEVPVRDALRQEEKRPYFLFVSKQTPVDDVVEKFVSNPALEVVLITENGKRTEKLLGIITAFDIVRLE